MLVSRFVIGILSLNECKPENVTTPLQDLDKISTILYLWELRLNAKVDCQQNKKFHN